MKKTKNNIKLNYYQAEIRINTTALIELLEKEVLFDNEEIIKVFEVYGTIFIILSQNDIMKEIECLYPNVFKKCEPSSFQGNILFST